MNATPMPQTMMTRRHLLGFLSASAGAAVLAACGGTTAATETAPPKPAVAPTAAATAAITGTAPQPATSGSAATGAAAMPTLVIEAVDFGYRAMGSIPAGVTSVQMKNLGAEVHHAQLMRLNANITLDQFTAAFKMGPDAIFPLATFVGGPGAVAPMGKTEVVLDLAAGQHVIACFVEGADHIAHAAKGMVLPLMVTPGAGAAAMPKTTGTVTLVDFSFEMPATLPAGRSFLQVVNKGPQLHEFNIMQLLPGKSLDDVKAFFDPAPGTMPAGAPPALPIGGMNGLSIGATGITVLDLMPGTYVAVCNVPDQSKPNGASHLHLGMIKSFTVA